MKKALKLPPKIETNLTKIRGIGPKRSEKLKAAGINSVKDRSIDLSLRHDIRNFNAFMNYCTREYMKEKGIM